MESSSKFEKKGQRRALFNFNDFPLTSNLIIGKKFLESNLWDRVSLDPQD